MKHRKFPYLLASTYLTIAVGSSRVINADDTEIYLTSSIDTGSVSLANLSFNLDTSTSMSKDADENKNGVLDPNERRRGKPRLALRASKDRHILVQGELRI